MISSTPLQRTATLSRTTSETSVRVDLTLDGRGTSTIETGIGFLDHLCAALARHSGIDLVLRCTGDLSVDDHHTVEDCALALGSAIDAALGDRRGIMRFGHAYAPLDDALARVVVDLSGRPFAHAALYLKRDRLGSLSCENIPHFLSSMASTMRAAVHADVLHGVNDHHKAEATFKALALALRMALHVSGTSSDVPSTKGVL
jgi:imidazoleglycerol phosphate dehydratase HisB